MKRVLTLAAFAISLGTLALFADTIHPTLINGTVVQPGQWKPVIQIQMGNVKCTATLVGPRVFITAAHCADTSANATFSVDGTSYKATMERSPLYPNQDHDIALGLVEGSVPIAPYSVGGKVVVGMDIHILGFGCKDKGGGASDGMLREGRNRVTALVGFDMKSNGTPNGAALCFGDSGGPAFDIADLSRPSIVGINSKGNLKDTNYNTNLDLEESKNFIRQWAQSKSVEICGVNRDCGGSIPTPIPTAFPTNPIPTSIPTPIPTSIPGASSFTMDGKFLKVQATMNPGFEIHIDYVKSRLKMWMMNLDAQISSF